MENLEYKTLNIEAKDSGGEIIISFKGRSADRNPGEAINPYFENLVREINKKTILDFRQLEFMNSSTVPPLLNLIKMLNNKEIKTFLYYNSESSWQSASFKAFGTVSTTLPFITVEGK